MIKNAATVRVGETFCWTSKKIQKRETQFSHRNGRECKVFNSLVIPYHV